MIHVTSTMKVQLSRLGIQEVPDTMQVFYRLQLCTELFYSKKYGRVKKRNSYTIAYSSASAATQQLCFAEVIFFFVINGLPFELNRLFNIFNCQLTAVLNGAMYHIVSRSSSVIRAESILFKCVCSDIQSTCYVVLFPCKYSCD